MSTFSYNDYQNNAPKTSNDNNSNGPKIGWFKTLGDGESAVVRFAIHSADDFRGATTHTANFGTRFEGIPGFSGISCLNPYGSYGNCPFCNAADAGHAVIGKAKQKIFVPMLVCYKDPKTNAWTAPTPVIWERPYGFAKELTGMITEYGDLSKRLFKITRTGQKTETRYTPLPIDKDSTSCPASMIPEDFSAFEGYDPAKHDYWVKSAADMMQYLAEGKFASNTQASTPAAPAASSQYGAPYVPAAPAAAPVAPATPAQTVAAPVAPQAPQSPVEASEPAAAPARQFGGFHF